ncbi:hypothetical protein, partial [Klebsiella pneumoniae]|uniref:hypothetical protein n=1 Tax=Klebsiella pneumoniae TaxID=573 RepID=UPI0034D4A3EE
VTDYMPAGDGSHLIRLVEGIEGRVAMRMDLAIRFDFGSAVPWVTRNELGDLRAVSGPQGRAAHRRAPARLRPDDGGGVH